ALWISPANTLPRAATDPAERDTVALRHRGGLACVCANKIPPRTSMRMRSDLKVAPRNRQSSFVNPRGLASGTKEALRASQKYGLLASLEAAADAMHAQALCSHSLENADSAKGG